jgi:hypothetical protein
VRVAFGKPEDARDDANGERERELADQVGRAAIGEAVDQLVDDAPDHRRLPLREQLRAKGRGNECARRPVVGFVHGDDRATEHRRHDLAEERRRERLVVAEDGGDLVVAEDAHRRQRVLEAVGLDPFVAEGPVVGDRRSTPGGRQVGVRVLDGADLEGLREVVELDGG